MGTRGSVGFVHRHETIAAYNHFDSYPEGLGAHVNGFVKGFVDKGASLEVTAKVANLLLVDESEDAPQEEVDRLGLVPQNVSRGTDWYAYLRDAQGDLAAYLELGVFPNNPEFLQDSLFCEYAYLVNLDTARVEYYKGFQRLPEGGYGPVAKVGEITFKQFQDLTIEELYEKMNSFYEEDEDE